MGTNPAHPPPWSQPVLGGTQMDRAWQKSWRDEVKGQVVGRCPEETRGCVMPGQPSAPWPGTVTLLCA